VVLAAIGNFGHSHLFRSQDGGRTWQDLDQCCLPNGPLQSVVIPADATDRIYVSGDLGVFVYDDHASAWMDLTLNLPNVMVVDLAYCKKDRTLRVATYGRSIWSLKLP
jgi:photosystem II stability/assembly factor-like uncharacterized protein